MISAPHNQISKVIELNNPKQKSVNNCSLKQALEYQNNDVIHRFTTLWELSFEEAQDLFLETKKWLWLSTQSDNQKLIILEPMKIIDEMWHNFILFSQSYQEYCQDCFGYYIHHEPSTHSEKEAMKQATLDDPIGTAEKRKQENMQQGLLIYRKLGIETWFKWYLEYPQKYNQDFFNQSSKSVKLKYTLSDEIKQMATLFKQGRLVVRN